MKTARPEHSRRNFLFGASKSLASLAVANIGIYAIGSAFKSLDGSIVAGAKSCECLCWRQNFFCGHSGPNEALETCFTSSAPFATCAQKEASGCAGTQRINSCIPN